MKIIAIVQARMTSTRLPKKVMKKINDKTLIELLLQRLSGSKQLNQIIVVTSHDKANQELIDHVNALGYPCEQGSENNVLERYVHAAKKYKADIVVRITGDCPLIDPEIVDACISKFNLQDVDYLSNNYPANFPDGLDVEVVTTSALEVVIKDSMDSHDLEHVTSYIRSSGRFKISSISSDLDYSDMRWTVDEPEDFEVVRNIFDYFWPRTDFGWKEVLQLYKKEPKYFTANKHIYRNEGAFLGTGQKLWKRAKKVIPGGNMLLSKRSEMFLPEQWPSYFSRTKGYKVWDLDGKVYKDMSIMGIGTNSLGYSNAEVDDAVKSAVTSGNMSTLNCPEEVYLAEKLVELHPWAEMVKFARSGGEANAIAIRIARAYSGKDNVAFCGYHGWHDWYLSSNIGTKDSLEAHLLPGLEPNGVPVALKDTAFAFQYNDFSRLEYLVKHCNVGTIKMEVIRNREPVENFLQKVRQLATDNNVVLIFDECTSGFRETFGGIHKKYNIEPDITMFGKALGNGYAITAVVGKKQIMEAAQSTFISSTFWTERVGSVAGLKTLEIMGRDKSWEKITNTGNMIKKKWQNLAEKYDLKIEQFGIPALAGFNFSSANNLEYKTLITQEMLKKGFLATNTVYSSTEHDTEVIDEYFHLLGNIFAIIGDCENGRGIMQLLDGPVCHGGFKRLN